MNKKKVIWIICIIIGCLIGSGLTEIKYNKVNEAKSVEEVLIEYGNIFPIEKFDALGIQEGTEDNKLYKIILYIDPYCDSCFEKFILVERMYSIFEKVEIDVNVVWKQEPKKSICDEIQIPKEKQYCSDRMKLLNEYPLFFLLDQNNKVIMITEDESKIVKKLFLLEQIDERKIIESANQYLKSLIEEDDTNKEDLIYFAMDGCPDCENAMRLLNESELLKNYDLLTIYTKESYGEEEYVDNGQLFMSLYNIEWYPSFLIIDDENYKFIGQETDEELMYLLEKGI